MYPKPDDLQRMIDAVDGKPVVFIETGTLRGNTLREAVKSGIFKRHYSIELSSKLYAEVERKFRREKRVTLKHGSSETVLPGIIAANPEAAFFWLDAHCSGGPTEGKPDKPLMEELEILMGRAVVGDVIAIDDVNMTKKNINNAIALSRVSDLLEKHGREWKFLQFKAAGPNAGVIVVKCPD